MRTIAILCVCALTSLFIGCAGMPVEPVDNPITFSSTTTNHTPVPDSDIDDLEKRVNEVDTSVIVEEEIEDDEFVTEKKAEYLTPFERYTRKRQDLLNAIDDNNKEKTKINDEHVEKISQYKEICAELPVLKESLKSAKDNHEVIQAKFSTTLPDQLDEVKLQAQASFQEVTKLQKKVDALEATKKELENSGLKTVLDTLDAVNDQISKLQRKLRNLKAPSEVDMPAEIKEVVKPKKKKRKKKK